jgi:hypothetical protein
VAAVADERPPPHRIVLGWRYPANTALAAMSLASLAAGLASLPLLGGIAAASALVNARFVSFALKDRGVAMALAAWPLSALEGFAYLAGMACAIRPTRTRSSTVRR